MDAAKVNLQVSKKDMINGCRPHGKRRDRKPMGETEPGIETFLILSKNETKKSTSAEEIFDFRIRKSEVNLKPDFGSRTL